MTPNSVLSSGKITNYTALGRRRAEIRVGASYDAAVSDVRAACLDAAGRACGVLPDPAADRIRRQLRREQHQLYRTRLVQK